MDTRRDFEARRAHLAGLSDDELYQRFWSLLDQVVTPLSELAETHTSPAVERSVLLRMGFSSLEAGAIVERCMQHGLMGKGAGNVVLTAARLGGQDYRAAGRELAAGRHWDGVERAFRGSAA